MAALQHAAQEGKARLGRQHVPRYDSMNPLEHRSLLSVHIHSTVEGAMILQWLLSEGEEAFRGHAWPCGRFAPASASSLSRASTWACACCQRGMAASRMACPDGVSLCRRPRPSPAMGSIQPFWVRSFRLRTRVVRSSPSRSARTVSDAVVPCPMAPENAELGQLQARGRRAAS